MSKVIECFLWATAIIIIIGCGIYYTYKLHGVQFRFTSMLKNIFKKSYGGISSFSSLMVSLGGRIGVGSIAGVALAIYLGGIGTIFWIWMIGLICAPNVFAETVLGIKYQNKDFGGPSCYISKGLGLKRLSRIYSYIIIFSYIGGFLSIQSNTITTSVTQYLYISPIIIGIIIGSVSLIIINGGIKKIARVSNFLVPIMIFIYVISSLYIVFMNIDAIPHLLISIIVNAFNVKAFGFGVLSTCIIGVQRGVFANEVGLGTGAIASSMVKTEYPAECGFVQMIGIYITTFLVCTSTALVVLLSNSSGIAVNGIESVQYAFSSNLGFYGELVVIISIILFAFSTVLSGYYNGESSLNSLYTDTSKKNNYFLKILTVIVIIFGSVSKATLLWRIVDILTALLAIINSYAIFKLKDDVILELERYNKCGKMK